MNQEEFLTQIFLLGWAMENPPIQSNYKTTYVKGDYRFWYSKDKHGHIQFVITHSPMWTVVKYTFEDCLEELLTVEAA